MDLKTIMWNWKDPKINGIQKIKKLLVIPYIQYI